MATRDIKTFHETIACDVCGRTLLRGERTETWLAGGQRREVCELCTPRAMHEGWIREDARLEMTARSPVGERRPSLLARLRRRRGRGRQGPAVEEAAEDAAPIPFEEDFEPEPEWVEETAAPPPEPEPELEPEPEPVVKAAPPPERDIPRTRRPTPLRPRYRRDGSGAEAARASEPAPPSPPPPPAREPEPPRRPRDVHAVPTSPGHRVAVALEAFNRTDHVKTVAGVARSLGAPTVSARPVDGTARVMVVASWELCWYRYEVELAHGPGSVQQLEQGYELDELPAEDKVPTAIADEQGNLHPAA